jgi:hypothetical protein
MTPRVSSNSILSLKISSLEGGPQRDGAGRYLWFSKLGKVQQRGLRDCQQLALNSTGYSLTVLFSVPWTQKVRPA